MWRLLCFRPNLSVGCYCLSTLWDSKRGLKDHALEDSGRFAWLALVNFELRNGRLEFSQGIRV